MRFSRHVWWLYLALMAPITVAYLAGPLNAGPVFNAIGFGACVAIVVGVRRHKPAARLSWYLIALGQAFFVAGDVLAYKASSQDTAEKYISATESLSAARAGPRGLT
jgi:hypothetical protein